MALTKEDLQAIGELMDSKLAAERAHTQEMFATERTHTQEMIDRAENRILAYIESSVEPKIKAIAEGHSLLNEKLNPLLDLPDKVDDIQNNVSLLASVLKEHIHN